LIFFAFTGIDWNIISNILCSSIISDIAPEAKITTCFAVLNFSIVIPQVTAAFLPGF
jgi:hypothetical protein